MSEKLYHLQFKSPPEGSYTGLNNTEIIEPYQDQSNDMEQIQHRITLFENEWSAIKKFYENYSFVVQVETNSEMDRPYLSDEIQNQINEFNLMRERKLKQEIEAKLALENALINKKKAEEEEAILAKQKEEEAKAASQAAELEAQKVKFINISSSILYNIYFYHISFCY